MVVDEMNKQAVVVTDIRMPFFSIVIFMVKWTICNSGLVYPYRIRCPDMGTARWAPLSLTIGKNTDSVRTMGIETPTLALLHGSNYWGSETGTHPAALQTARLITPLLSGHMK